MGHVVAIVGRPNVGKSTLFNRLCGNRKAIVDDISGVTRDRQYGKAEWQDRNYTVIDTGGYVPESSDIFEISIKDQVEIAVQEADYLFFVTDTTTGITDLDDAMADLMRRAGKRVFLVVNKVDNFERQMDANEFYNLGFDNIFFISAMSGSGTGDLLEALEIEMKKNDKEEIEEDPNIPKIAFIGRPNVGKSSLVNALLGKERNIVTPIAGTTRDSVHSKYNAYGHEYLLIDTAGIRRRTKVTEQLEFYSVLRSIKAIEDADIVILILDATLGMESQDMNLLGQAKDAGKGIIILVNKWDLIEKETNTAKEYETKIKEKTAPFVDFPVIFISATEKLRIHKAMEVIQVVSENQKRRIPTKQLNDYILQIIEETPPPAIKGKYVKVKYVTQLKTRRTNFICFCNHPQYVQDAYHRFIENKLRSEYNFTGVPIEVHFRKK